ncbi:hypothetical protein SDC9_195692 [bioreactor metagenome]|uniref:Uncharacterized protein n=1 Tax=bioreactor metagenome TaxID=1076179 RepID=A0A645IA11_9ZZZZ
MQHVGEVDRCAHGVHKALRLHHELRELDLVERAQAVGQLHTGLELAIALPCHRCFPLLRGLVEAFHRKRLAARTARGRHGCQRGVTRDELVSHDGGERIDQRIETTASLRRRQRHLQRVLQVHGMPVEARFDIMLASHALCAYALEAWLMAHGRRIARGVGLDRPGPLGRVAVGGPGVVADDDRQYKSASDD